MVLDPVNNLLSESLPQHLQATMSLTTHPSIHSLCQKLYWRWKDKSNVVPVLVEHAKYFWGLQILKCGENPKLLAVQSNGRSQQKWPMGKSFMEEMTFELWLHLLDKTGRKSIISRRNNTWEGRGVKWMVTLSVAASRWGCLRPEMGFSMPTSLSCYFIPNVARGHYRVFGFFFFF